MKEASLRLTDSADAVKANAKTSTGNSKNNNGLRIIHLSWEGSTAWAVFDLTWLVPDNSLWPAVQAGGKLCSPMLYWSRGANAPLPAGGPYGFSAATPLLFALGRYVTSQASLLRSLGAQRVAIAR
jgi:hypothetical protein